MIDAKLNIIPFLLSGILALSACSTTAPGPFGQVEDDAYFSRKQSHKKDVYVPEVDVQEIIKANPPQYGNDGRQQRYEDNGGTSDFNYDQYKYNNEQQRNNPQYTEESSSFLSTTPYVGQEEEAAEAARLRMQYSGSYNTYNTYNYYNDPYYANNGWGNNGFYNNWYTPTVGIGFNSWGGWGLGVGVGMGWGWNNWGWGGGWGYGWPHYNPYWGGAYGYNPWMWNNWGWGYGFNNCGWGWGCGGYGYPGYWGYNSYAERAAPRTVRPRQSAGSSLPRGENIQPRGSGMTSGPGNAGQQERAMPRNPNQGQLINRDGQQIYVAPEQNRTTPRTYNTYDRSVRDGQIQREVAPAPQQPQRQQRNISPRSTAPSQPQGTYRGGQNQQTPRSLQPTPPPSQRNYNPGSAPSQPSQRNYSPAPSAPSSPRPMSPPSGGGGGGRGSSGGGGGGSMPRR